MTELQITDAPVPVVGAKRFDVYGLRVVCPYCGQHHYHGTAGKTSRWHDHRVADCDRNRLSPELREARYRGYYVLDLSERRRPLLGKLHPENAMCLISDLDQLYSDMLDARVDDATRWEALRLLIRATILDIDDGGIRDVIGWWSDLLRGKLSLLEAELAKSGQGHARPAKADRSASAKAGWKTRRLKAARSV